MVSEFLEGGRRTTRVTRSSHLRSQVTSEVRSDRLVCPADPWGHELTRRYVQRGHFTVVLVEEA